MAVLLPALLGSAIGAAYLYEEQQQFQHASLRETARALALSLEREMARRETLLQTLAVSPALQSGDLDTFYRYSREVAAERDAAIILSDMQGRQLLNTRLPLGRPLPPMLPQERELRARFGSERTLVSDVYLPPAGLGPHSFAVEVPVRRGGQVVQFLAMASFASQLQALLVAQRLPVGWHATIVDRNGRVVARSVDGEKYVGSPIRPDLLARIQSADEGMHEGLTLAGAHSTAFFTRSPHSQWTFLVAVPTNALYGAGLRAAAWIGTVSLVLLGLGLLAALHVGRRIAHPIERLRRSAERLGLHQPVAARPALGSDEADAVHHALAQASEQLRRANAELEQRVTEAVNRYERSQRALVQAQKLEALGRLTGGIAHDFNNVLQTLTTGLHAARRNAPRELEDLLVRCQRAVTRGTELARQLMAFGRVQEVRAQTIAPGQRIAEARPLLQGALPTNISLVFNLLPDLWPVTVDPAQLELALLNLVMNARDAMPAGGRIVLQGGNQSLSAGAAELIPGDYVTLAVVDNGEGMSEDVLAHALDPFFTTKAVGKGSGMGLPQAYGFARQSGGTLTLHSVQGQGSTVTLHLPRASDMPALGPDRPAAAELPHGRGRVLLVEDDELVREIVSAALTTAGFEVQTAVNADSAMQRMAAGEAVDVVFTDVVMPGASSGLDLAQHILQSHPGTRVVVATGYSDRAVQLPGVRMLPKPYGMQDAVAALNQAMAERSAEPQA